MKRQAMRLQAILFVILIAMTHVDICAQNKTSVEKEKAKVEKIWLDFCKQANSQTPIFIDEYTQLNSIMFINWTLHLNYQVSYEKEIFTAEEIEEIKKEHEAESRKMIQDLLGQKEYSGKRNDFRGYMKFTGMKMKMNYYDVNLELIYSLTYTYLDF